MRILLLSMPDSFEHMPAFGMRIPVSALTSLAGNVDQHHHAAVADLILVQRQVRRTVERLVSEQEPDLVGLSVMTFQRPTAQKIMGLVRLLRPAARIAVGGPDPSLAPEAYAAMPHPPDFIVRGEGEITFRELLRALERGGDCSRISGLSYRDGGQFHHNEDRPAVPLSGGEIRLPNRNARVLGGYTLVGRPIDVVETSRGCTFDCGFCSIIQMRGRNFYTYPLDRVLADIRDANKHGARAIFFVDDNITIDVPRFEALCRAIIEGGLNRLDYIVQAMTSAIALHGETLAPLMRKAGFRYVFLGIENILEEDLKFLRARAKNKAHDPDRSADLAAVRAIQHLHGNGLRIVGGLIVGNPDDTQASIRANLEFARRHVDWPYIQHPTPYPRTPLAESFRAQGLIASGRPEEYDGTTAVVRTRHLPAEEVEFMRWRAERWIKLHHLPSVLLHSPLFVARNGFRMLAHTFRGSTLKSALGLEDAHVAFRRYKRIREAERDYL